MWLFQWSPITKACGADSRSPADMEKARRGSTPMRRQDLLALLASWPSWIDELPLQLRDLVSKLSRRSAVIWHWLWVTHICMHACVHTCAWTQTHHISMHADTYTYTKNKEKKRKRNKQMFSPVFLPSGLIVSGPTFKVLVNFELIFIYNVRKMPKSMLTM